MVKVYGRSDDLVEIEGSKYREDEIGCFERDVRIWFEDGTVIRVGYPKKDFAVWWVEIECAGSADTKLQHCNDEEAEIYSDIFEIDSEIIRHEVVLPLHYPYEKKELLKTGWKKRNGTV